MCGSSWLLSLQTLEPHIRGPRFIVITDNDTTVAEICCGEQLRFDRDWTVVMSTDGAEKSH